MDDHTAATGGRRRGRVAAVASLGVAALLGSVLYAVPASAGTPSPAAGPVAGVQAETPAAATFQQVPPAQVKNAYDEQLFTPPTGGGATTYTVYRSSVDTSVTPNVTYFISIASTPDAGTVDLNDGLVLDLASGTITASAIDLPRSDAEPESYIVVVNNGAGGAETASEGTLHGQAGYTAIPVALHDVSSGPFSIPVLYKDVTADNPFLDAIYGLSALGIMTGYADGSFQPTRPITRQTFARTVVQALSHGSYGTGPHPCTYGGLQYLGLTAGPFNDVPWTNPFCMDIMVLSVYGIAHGYRDGGFHPTALISRQTMAAMAFRLYGVGVFGELTGDALCITPIPFNDVQDSNPFCGDIEWMHASGVSNGYDDGSYRPTMQTTRQAGAAFLYRFFMKYGSALQISGPFPTPEGQGLTGADVAHALASAEAAGASR